MFRRCRENRTPAPRNHCSDVAFGGFPTGHEKSSSHSVCYPICVATHGDATGRLFYVPGTEGTSDAIRGRLISQNKMDVKRE